MLTTLLLLTLSVLVLLLINIYLARLLRRATTAAEKGCAATAVAETSDLAAVRARARRDISAAETAREQAVLLELLPVLDNLGRALQAAPLPPLQPAVVVWLDGVRLTHQDFLNSLARLGVQPVNAQGQPFDPRLHAATAMVEDTTQPPGMVVAVLREGFVQGSRLVRPALCTVSCRPASD